MLNLFRRSLRIGIRTTAYPDQPESPPPAFRGQVMLDPTRCTGEAACAAACPSQAITVDRQTGEGWIWQIDDARCVFCGLCHDYCPSSAIVISQEFELAVRTRTDLVTRARFSSGGGRLPIIGSTGSEGAVE